MVIANPNGLTTDHHCTMRELFGGAVGCAIPDNFVDVSGFRQVPDNQEVYADPQSDHSVIVEILEYVSSEQLAGMAPARYFFNDIAEANGAVAGSVRVLSTAQIPSVEACPSLPSADIEVHRIIGEQRIAKFGAPGRPANAIAILLLNIRCVAIQTDIIITMNVPRPSVTGGDMECDGDGGGSGGGDGGSDSATSTTPADISEAEALFDRITRSFAIRDWSLFG